MGVSVPAGVVRVSSESKVVYLDYLLDHDNAPYAAGEAVGSIHEVEVLPPELNGIGMVGILSSVLTCVYGIGTAFQILVFGDELAAAPDDHDAWTTATDADFAKLQHIVNFATSLTPDSPSGNRGLKRDNVGAVLMPAGQKLYIGIQAGGAVTFPAAGKIRVRVGFVVI
ncbi:MAG TPA: hypothetical protein VNI57_01450 [Candidatus Saccharimonadales bacterium]|nr:hypothetical protein [Candidatus Saccharimonadales bacterium]